ncbi:Calpain-type cysteine protease DEK1 [Diplonema papillatum]|nr:Calpain-type cysteine protease DEK1 [Diplonema papillatum]
MPPKKEEVKEGLFMEEKKAADGTHLLFHNATRDKQYIVTCGFTGDVKPVGDTKADGDKFKLSVYPGESLTMVKGSWTKMTKKFAGGPPDKAWVEKQMKESSEKVEKDISAVKTVLKKKGVTKVTADATAKACAEAGIKFVDITFPPRDSSLKSENVKREIKMYPWKRPDTFLEGTGLKPALFVGDIEPNDIDQGALADCYLMGALSAVAEFERLVRSCFESGQDPDLGLYRVSLCKNGWWQTVIVDDFLPCSGPKPAFARNRDEPHELWVSLIEKAYAKVHGSFAAIMSGGAAPALGDLTGCPYKTFDFEGEGATSFDQLLLNDEHEFLQVLGTPGKNIMYVPESAVTAEQKKLWDEYQAVGLICEHSYSLITVKKTSKGDELCMIRNPWGNDKEWTGKWSDSDKSWTPELKKECGFVASDDGTFWMSYADVKKFFNSIAINYCHGTWDQVRCAGNFEKGSSDLVVALDCKKDCRVWFGLHQKDSRGCKPGTADATYVGMNMFVVKGGAKASVLVSTGTQKRDVYQEATLKAGGTYFMLGQPKDDKLTKSFVYSMLIEEKDNVSVSFRTGKGKRYGNAKEFNEGDWSATEAQYQIKGQFSTNSTVVTRQGKVVTFDGASELGLKTEQSNFVLTIAADRKKKDMSAEAKTMLTLSVTVSKGRKLAAKDDSGFSDPYCEVKLRGYENGRVLGSHRHPQKQVTSVKVQTLNPEWNETFSYVATATDVIRVHCFDKDEVGKEALGRVDVLIPDLLTKGLKVGSSVKDWYPVVGDPQDGKVSGDLEVAVKLEKEEKS